MGHHFHFDSTAERKLWPSQVFIHMIALVPDVMVTIKYFLCKYIPARVLCTGGGGKLPPPKKSFS